jgi:hypothetical protein
MSSYLAPAGSWTATFVGYNADLLPFVGMFCNTVPYLFFSSSVQEFNCSIGRFQEEDFEKHYCVAWRLKFRVVCLRFCLRYSRFATTIWLGIGFVFTIGVFAFAYCIPHEDTFAAGLARTGDWRILLLYYEEHGSALLGGELLEGPRVYGALCRVARGRRMDRRRRGNV